MRHLNPDPTEASFFSLANPYAAGCSREGGGERCERGSSGGVGECAEDDLGGAGGGGGGEHR